MASTLDIDARVPLVVDLDGTLTLTDTLYESFAKLLFQNPAAALASTLYLMKGPAAVKRYTSDRCRLDPAALPYRSDLVEILRTEKARGREIHLVSAADQAVADAIAGASGLFETSAGSDGADNLKGARIEAII